MMKDEKRYSIAIENAYNVVGRVGIANAASVSEAVQAFLRQYLKNDSIRVEITEHACTDRRV